MCTYSYVQLADDVKSYEMRESSPTSAPYHVARNWQSRQWARETICSKQHKKPLKLARYFMNETFVEMGMIEERILRFFFVQREEEKRERERESFGVK